jgi:hypothetical protein
VSATVGATLSGVAFPDRHAGLGPFISSAGNVFFFGRDTTNVGHIEPHRATDPMSSFTAGTTKLMSSAAATSIQAAAAYQVGDVIHVATQISTGAGYYNQFDMAASSGTGAWSITTSEVAMAANTSGFAPTTGGTFVSLVVRSSGNVVFAFSGGQSAMSSTFNTCYYRIRTGTNTYGTATKFDNAGSNNWVPGPAALGASDRVHFFLTNNTTASQYQRTLTSANALQTFPAAWGNNFSQLFSYGQVASYVSGASTVVAAPCAYTTSAANNQLHVASLTSSDAPTATDALVGGFAAGTGVRGVNSQNVHAVAADTSTLHYLYGYTGDNDIYHDNDSGTGTWGTDVNEYAGTTLNALSTNVYTRSGTKYLAMVLDDGGTIKYAEITLAGAPAPTSLAYDPYALYRILTAR